MHRVVFALMAVALTACDPIADPVQDREIAPASVLQEKYDLYAENRPQIQLDPEEVPSALRDLIPFAETWGIGDDIIRADFEEKSADVEKDRFRSAITGRTAEISAWLDSLPEGGPMSDEAAAFMFMLEALDEMGLWTD